MIAQQNATLQLDKTGNLTGFFPPYFETKPVNPTELNRHVAALSSKVFEERKAATNALVQAGSQALELLEEMGPKSAELKYRTEKIRKLIDSKGLPDLKRKIEFDFSDVQTAALSPNGKLIVIARKNAWRSDLVIAEFKSNGIDGDNQTNVIGNLTCHHQIETIEFQSERQVLVGYSNGSVDRFKIANND